MKLNIPDSGLALSGKYYSYTNRLGQNPITVYSLFQNPASATLLLEISPDLDSDVWFPVAGAPATGGIVTITDNFKQIRVSVQNPSANTGTLTIWFV